MPASLVFASAATVDGHKVYYAWRGSDSTDVSFENQIVTSVAPSYIRIQTDLILSEPIKRNETFSISVSFDYGQADSVTVNSVILFDENNNRIDTLYPTINNGVVELSAIHVDTEVSYIRYFINVTRPVWIVKNANEITFTIDGSTYRAESGMTWVEWANSTYNSLGLIVDGMFLYTANKSKILSRDGIAMISTVTINDGGAYVLSNYSVTRDFCYMGSYYSYEEGMTWAEWVNSSYNTDGFILQNVSDYQIVKDNAGNRVAYISKAINNNSGEITYSGPFNIRGDQTIKEFKKIDSFNSNLYTYTCYGSMEYCNSIKSGTILPETMPMTFALVNYYYDFACTSVLLEIEDEKGLLNGIIGWLKNLYDSITELPSKIANGIGEKLTAFGTWIIDQIKGLFIPSEESIIELKTKFEELLRDRFGAVYDSADIIDDFASSFAYSDTDTSVTFPQVTVNLAGTNFTFGGWEVDVIPDRFEGIVDFLKLLVSMVATVLFVNALRKRLEDILE